MDSRRSDPPEMLSGGRTPEPARPQCRRWRRPSWLLIGGLTLLVSLLAGFWLAGGPVANGPGVAAPRLSEVLPNSDPNQLSNPEQLLAVASADSVDQRAIDASSEELAALVSADALPASPLDLSAFCQNVGYQQRGSNRCWQAQSDLSCDAAATLILRQLRSAGWQLESAGYLDLFGAAWGCLVSRPENGEVLMISLLQAQQYAPASLENPLIVRLNYLSRDSYLGAP